MSKYYEAEEKEIKVSDRVFGIYSDGNFYQHKLQGGWDTDESGPWWYKVLDREDIEELGWVRNKDDDRMHHISFTNGECTLYFEEGEEVVITSIHPKVKNFDNVIFHGEIRNYNDLKFIMQRTGIEIKETPEELLDALEIIYMGSLSENLYNKVQATIDKYPTYFAEYIDGPPEKVAKGYRYKIKL